MESNTITSFRGQYGFLSNYHRSPFEAPFYKDSCSNLLHVNNTSHGTHHFSTNEHYFQSAKARDYATACAIANAENPAAAKQIGRSIDKVENWDAIKVDVMLSGLRHKFSRRGMAERLVQTGTARLIEGNSWGDDYWGMVYNGVTYIGENWLGRLLELVREECRNAL